MLRQLGDAVIDRVTVGVDEDERLVVRGILSHDILEQARFTGTLHTNHVGTSLPGDVANDKVIAQLGVIAERNGTNKQAVTLRVAHACELSVGKVRHIFSCLLLIQRFWHKQGRSIPTSHGWSDLRVEGSAESFLPSLCDDTAISGNLAVAFDAKEKRCRKDYEHNEI